MWTEIYLWYNCAVLNNHCCFISMWIYFSQESYVSGIQINAIKLNAVLINHSDFFFFFSICRIPHRMFPILECTLMKLCSGCLLHVCHINQRVERDESRKYFVHHFKRNICHIWAVTLSTGSKFANPVVFFLSLLLLDHKY